MRLFKQVAAVVVLLTATVSADFGLGSIPQMGWSSWYTYGCDITADKIKKQADLMVENGLFDLGFRYILIDDCWQARARNSTDNKLYADPIKFPEGMGPVVDYIHSKNLSAGIYSSAGVKTCAGYPGSLGFEFIDAQQYADWGFDYLKYDNCYQQGQSNIQRFSDMGTAINNTGHDMFYAICNWGNANVAEWAPFISQSWRTTPDILIGEIKGNEFFQVQANFLRNQEFWNKAGPGGWNDPDMLILGAVPDLTEQQIKTHFALWSFAKAPLILSTDLSKLGNVTNSSSIAYTLNNKHLIKINQGLNGHQAQRLEVTNTTGQNDTIEFYKTVVEEESGELYYAVMLINWYDKNVTAKAELDFSAHGIALSSFDKCEVMDLWTEKKQQVGGGKHQFETVGMQMHDHFAYKIKCDAF